MPDGSSAVELELRRRSCPWFSQADGIEKRKRGTIVAVVPVGRTPSSIDAAYKFASSRTHQSYVVDVDGELYWPLVPKLRITAAKVLR